jgi:hypothetical protein
LPRDKGPIVLSVCDVLRDIETLNGRTVTVRGTIAWTQRHGISEFVQEGLADPYAQRCPGMQGRKRSWPPALHVSSPRNLDRDETSVTFQEQHPDLSDLAATLRDHQQRLGREVFVATITGEVRTRENVRIKRRGDDIIGNGYGQGGSCPGLLIFKTIVGVEDLETHKSLPIRRRSR